MIKNLKLYLILVLLVSINTLCFAADRELDAKRRVLNRKHVTRTMAEISMMNEALDRGKEYGYSSSGLAKYFEVGMSKVVVKENIIYSRYLGTWTFTGDGNCSQPGKCYVKVKMTNPADTYTVQLIKNSKGHITVK